jgi:hypothetical protein
MRPYLKKHQPKKMAGGLAQGVGPEFQPQCCKKKKKKRKSTISTKNKDNQSENRQTTLHLKILCIKLCKMKRQFTDKGFINTSRTPKAQNHNEVSSHTH